MNQMLIISSHVKSIHLPTTCLLLELFLWSQFSSRIALIKSRSHKDLWFHKNFLILYHIPGQVQLYSCCKDFFIAHFCKLDILSTLLKFGFVSRAQSRVSSVYLETEALTLSIDRPGTAEASPRQLITLLSNNFNNFK